MKRMTLREFIVAFIPKNKQQNIELRWKENDTQISKSFTFDELAKFATTHMDPDVISFEIYPCVVVNIEKPRRTAYRMDTLTKKEMIELVEDMRDCPITCKHYFECIQRIECREEFCSLRIVEKLLAIIEVPEDFDNYHDNLIRMMTEDK